MRVIEKVSSALWDDIALSCPHATFFHTHYWAEFIEKTFSIKDVTKGFFFDNGVRVIFPLMLKRNPKLRSRFLEEYISGPLYVYGGPISDGELKEQQIIEISQYINSSLKKYRSILIRGNPFFKNIRLSGFKEMPDLSHVVELYKYKSELDLLKSYSRGIRSHINKAKRLKLNIREAKTIDKFEELYNIYQRTKKYWENNLLTNYPMTMFQNIFKLKNRNIIFWTVNYEGRMIGGSINLYWNNFCQLLLFFSDREFSKMHANRHLLHNILLDCKERNIKYFDFRQSGGIKGVEFFKRSMGAKEYPFKSLLKETILIKQIYSLRRKIISSKMLAKKIN